jgi:hypothetical protein
MHIIIYMYIHKQWGGHLDPTPEMYVDDVYIYIYIYMYTYIYAYIYVYIHISI